MTIQTKPNRVFVHLLGIVLISIIVRLIPLLYLGPQREPDTGLYLQVTGVLSETGRFATVDPVSGEIILFAMRVPFFHLVLAGLIKIFGSDIFWPVAIMNLVLSVITVLLTAVIFYFIAGPSFGYLSGYFMAVDPNSIYNALLIMPDTFFSLFCLLAVVFGIVAVTRHSRGWFFVWGMVIGITVMIKPVFKYYWIVTFVVLIYQIKSWKEIVKYGLFITLSIGIILVPWLWRNYKEFNFMGLDLSGGLNSIWSTTDLVKLSTEKQRQTNPQLAAVRDAVFHTVESYRKSDIFGKGDVFEHFNYPVRAWENVQKELGLSVVETDRLLMKIGKEVVFQEPQKVFFRFAMNTVNFLNSPASMLELICRIVPGAKMYRMPLSVAWKQKIWIVVLPTLIIRFIYLLVIILSLIGSVIFWKKSTNSAIPLLLILTILYFIPFSFVAGYDRYRLPIDPLLVGLASTAIVTYIKKLKNKI